MFFDNLTWAQLLTAQALTRTAISRRESSAQLYVRSSEMELRAAWNRHNLHVFYILHVTTFRTIDLEGKKNYR